MRASNKKKFFLTTLIFGVFIFFPFLIFASYYPSAAWSPVPESAGNYSPNYNRNWENINSIVIHTGQGSYKSIINWLKNPWVNASSHYVVSKNGNITSMVHDEDVAWHAGNWQFNTVSIGIEHEGWVEEIGSYTEEMYKASANLSRYLISKWKIPPTHLTGGVRESEGIFGHNQVLNPKCKNCGCGSCEFGGCSCHWDPGAHWNWNHYMNLITGGGKPDLTVKNLKIEPEKFYPGDKIKISFQIKNQGKGDTIGTFHAEAALNESEIFSKEAIPLNSGASQNISFYYTFPQNTEKYNLKIEISDSWNYIIEENSKNNAASKELQAILNQPPITEILSISIDGNNVSFKGAGKDPDEDKIKYVWTSSIDGKLSEEPEFKKYLTNGKHRIYFQAEDERKLLSISVFKDIEVEETENLQELEINSKINLSEKESKKEFDSAKVYHFPININFEVENPNFEIWNCQTKNCLPLNEEKLTGFELAVDKSKDAIIRYQAINPENGAVSKIKEIKIILRTVDINSDKKIDLLDFSTLAINWGKSSGFSNNAFKSDLNADGIIDLLDFSILAINWGK